MRAGRTLLALIVLFVGVLALLVLRYDAWVYASMLDHPIVMTLLVGTATLLLALEMTHRVQDPNRAVVFKEGRFHQLDPRGEILVWPGMDIGAEVSLAEQRVLGWPVLVYDSQGKEHTFLFALTWRIVPTGPRPGPREQRMLLMPNGERRTIVVQSLERVTREVARLCTPEQLRELAANARFLEALRDRVNADLTPDALVMDRLHVVRLMLAESKKDEPKAFRETRTITQTRDWQGQLHGHGQADAHLPLPLPPAPPPLSPPSQAGSAPHIVGPVVDSNRANAAGEGMQGARPGTTTVHEQLARTEEILRGQDKSGAKPASPASVSGGLLTAADHAAIVGAICQRSASLRQGMKTRDGRSGLAMLEAAMEAMPPSDTLRVRVALAGSIAAAVREAYPRIPPAVDATVETLMADVDVRDPMRASSACQRKSEAYRNQGDTVLGDALALTSGIAANGASTIFNPAWLEASGQEDVDAAEKLLSASINGAITGYLLGTMLSAAAAQSPRLAAALTPHPGTLMPQDAAIACAIEQAAEEIVR